MRDRFTAASQVFLPAIALGELHFGALKSNERRQNLARLAEFAADLCVLGCGAETARLYGELRNELRLQGRPIPDDDVWIAAIAREHELMLATRHSHFAEVEGIELATW